VANLFLKVNNDFDDLPAVANSATQFLRSKSASSDVIFAANLAIEEIVTNIVKYGYDDALNHEITIRLDVTANTLNIEICDDGKEFDPFNQPEQGIVLASKEPNIGGLGIYFVRRMLDTCEYDRRDGRNIVRLSKKL
jgi:anti-sigma regulatory factor (Ser/Thr protein kinase)